MTPEKQRGGPAITPNRPHTAIHPAQSVTPSRDNTPQPGRVLAAFVSLYEPSGRRRWWWYSYRCRTCKTYQLGRARSLDDVTGVRRGGCGHRVEIIIARVFGAGEAA